jgi:hypothetical protein
MNARKTKKKVRSQNFQPITMNRIGVGRDVSLPAETPVTLFVRHCCLTLQSGVD